MAHANVARNARRRRFRSSTPNRTQQFLAEQKERQRRGDMTGNTRQVIAGGPKSKRGVVERVGQSLDWPVEIGCGGVGKKEMLKTLGNQAPASDQRITLNQRGVVPDKTVAQGRRVESENKRRQKKSGQKFFHRSIALDRIMKMRV